MTEWTGLPIARADLCSHGCGANTMVGGEELQSEGITWEATGNDNVGQG